MNMYPKECVHKNCKEIFYVPSYKMHMLLVCEKCQTKRGEIE